MRGRVLGGLFLLAVGGCASNPAPDGWLAPPDLAVTDPYGAWIEVQAQRDVPGGRGSAPAARLEGELLAVDNDSLFVLGATGRVSALPLAEVRSGTVAYYDPQSGKLGTWTAIGVVSTLSHGFGLVFTMPLWIIVGAIAADDQARAALIRFDKGTPPAVIRAHARFPGGRPADLPEVLPLKPARNWTHEERERERGLRPVPGRSSPESGGSRRR